MKKNQGKKMMKTSLARMVLLAIAAAPVMTYAEGFDGSVTVGAAQASLDEPSAKFGEYSGVSDDDSWLLLDLNLMYQNGLTYFGAEGSGLGLDNRQLGLKGGRYGLFGLNLNYSEIPRLYAEDAKTPFVGELDNSLELPAGFVRGATTSAMTTLAADARSVEIATDRTTEDVSFFLTPNERWRFDFGVDRYSVTGHKPLGSAVFHNASVYLPVQVDQTMQAIRAALGYHTGAGQWELRYRHSNFTNDAPDITWKNPFTQVFTDGRIDLEPDNEQQTLTLSGALNLDPTTRLSVMAERSRLTQDDALLPYTTGTNGNNLSLLPVASPDAEIDISHLNVDLTSRPTKRLKINTRYHYQKTDNKTDSHLFQRVRTDRNDAPSATTSELAIYSLARDIAKSQFKIDADFTASASTSLHAAAQREIKAMTYRAVEKTKETTLSGGITQRFSSLAQVNLDVARARRGAASGYDDDRLFSSLHTSAFLSDSNNNTNVGTASTNMCSSYVGLCVQDTFENNPYLRQYDIADRKRDTLNLGVDLYPTADVVVGMRVRKITDRYVGGSELLGLRDKDDTSATLDVDYAPEDGVNVFGYITQERGSFDLKGRQFGLNARQGALTVADRVLGFDDRDLDWAAHNKDNILSAGLGGSYRMFGDRLLLKAKYDYSKSKTDVSYDANMMYQVTITGTTFSYAKVPVTVTDLPTVTTKYSRLELGGEYALQKKMILGLGVILGRFESYDPLVNATDTAPAVDAASTGASNVLSLIGPEDDYDSTVWYGTLTYKW
ncbi:MAG: MtrB/PioB family decaheme-associated outer membrane protein [Pseudomonadota bacterium]